MASTGAGKRSQSSVLPTLKPRATQRHLTFGSSAMPLLVSTQRKLGCSPLFVCSRSTHTCAINGAGHHGVQEDIVRDEVPEFVPDYVVGGARVKVRTNHVADVATEHLDERSNAVSCHA